MALRLTEEEYAALMARRGRTGAPHPSAPAALPPSPKGEGDLIRQPCGLPPSPKGEGRAKYGNRRVEVDGKKFDSQHEAAVYGELMLRRRAGEIRLVLRQVSFDLPGGIRYIADFVTVDAGGRMEVIDAKSEITRKNRVYINKKKQMLSEWGIEIQEV